MGGTFGFVFKIRSRYDCLIFGSNASPCAAVIIARGCGTYESSSNKGRIASRISGIRNPSALMMIGQVRMRNCFLIFVCHYCQKKTKNPRTTRFVNDLCCWKVCCAWSGQWLRAMPGLTQVIWA